jgi:hypothetical protein
MLDLFSPLPPEARRENLGAYRQFLAARDGDVDPEQRTLTRREEKMQDFLGPVANPRPVDRALFDKQYAGFDSRVETPEEMLLLLALVKTNAVEAYGVNQGFKKAYKRAIRNDDDLELVLLIEETYHTRILLSSSRLYGMDVTAPFVPNTGLKALIGGIIHMPEFVSRPLTLATEILGTMTFLNLLNTAGRILKDQPELRDAVEERLTEVLIDEIGHVSFNRMCLGSAGLAQARALLPIIAVAVGKQIGEIAALGAFANPTSDALAQAAGSFPETVRRQAFLA